MNNNFIERVNYKKKNQFIYYKIFMLTNTKINPTPPAKGLYGNYKEFDIFFFFFWINQNLIFNWTNSNSEYNILCKKERGRVFFVYEPFEIYPQRIINTKPNWTRWNKIPNVLRPVLYSLVRVGHFSSTQTKPTYSLLWEFLILSKTCEKSRNSFHKKCTRGVTSE